MTRAVDVVDGAVLDPVVAEVMESMTFAGAERAPDGEFEWDAEDLVWARIELLRPALGALWMMAREESALELTDVVWAGEIDPSADAACMVMAELVNAVGGQVLASLDAAGQVQLGLPETGAGRLRAGAGPEVRHAFVLDDGTPIGVLIRGATREAAVG